MPSGHRPLVTSRVLPTLGRPTITGVGPRGSRPFATGAVWALVRDPVRAERGTGGSFLTLLKTRELWPIFAIMIVCYAPAAGLRGLWLGPYFTDVHGYSRPEIGTASLWMGLAMVAGNFLLGPIDRITGSRKWGVAGSVALSAASLGLLVVFPAPGFSVSGSHARA